MGELLFMSVISTILKVTGLFILFLPILIINQDVLYKKEKRLKWKGFLVVYIILVIIFVLKDLNIV